MYVQVSYFYEFDFKLREYCKIRYKKRTWGLAEIRNTGLLGAECSSPGPFSAQKSFIVFLIAYRKLSKLIFPILKVFTIQLKTILQLIF